MANYLTLHRDSSLAFTLPSAFISTTKCNKCISYLIAKILQAILPKTWFCWISRGTVQLQSILRPIKWSYWTKLSDNVYLGAMPLKNWNHIDKITKCGIKAILSINEDHEFQTQLFADPVKPVDWKGKNINFLNITSPDLEPIKVSKLAKAVDYVTNQVNLGNPIYIHCTGGRGRSVSVAICSLTRIKACTLEESIKYVKQHRPQFMLNQKQINSIITWYEGESQKKSINSIYNTSHIHQVYVKQ